VVYIDGVSELTEEELADLAERDKRYRAERAKERMSAASIAPPGEDPPTPPTEDLQAELGVTDDTASIVLLALAGAFGMAGLLSFDVGPVFYFFPAGMAAISVVCLGVGAMFATSRQALIAVLAVVACVGSIAVGIAKYVAYDDVRDEADEVQRELTRIGETAP
jgi:hypothetical protein